MVGLEVPTDTITNHPILPRFLTHRSSPHTQRYTPLAIRENITPLRPSHQARSLDMNHWPQWARITLIAGLGLAALLLLVLAAFLCSRRRQRAGMTTVSQKDALESSSTISHPISQPVSQVPYGGFVSDAGAHLERPGQAMAPPRPLGALASPNPMGMYDVPLETSRGHGPADPFGPGQRAAVGGADMSWRGPAQDRTIGTSSMNGLSAASPQDHSAFSPWESPTKKKFKF